MFCEYTFCCWINRFQIFGDTVNTAARCESLGQPNRIHVSEATALLLQSSGKGGWLTQRADPVEAKGKGVIQTYWVNVGTVRKESSVVSSSHHEPTITEFDEEP
jgi:class 3 adenylate cyclase